MRSEARDRRVLPFPETPFRRPREVFVGRERELELLDLALAEAARGCGSVAVLVGEAGIGKTRTTQELAARAKALVLRGRCYEGEETPPYGPWRTALRSLPGTTLSREAEALLTESRGGPRRTLRGVEARARLFESMIALLRSSARRRVVLLILDNLQWADPGSLKLLEHLSAEISKIRLLAVGTYRDTDLDDHHPLVPILAELAKETGFRRITLDGLSPQQVGVYLERAMHIEPSPALVQEVHQRTEGNPLYLLEITREMAETRAPSVDRLRIPPGIRETIGARLARMPDGTVEVLTVASVIGRVFSLDLLTQLMEGASPDGISSALELARTAGFVQEMPEEPGRYRFAHALMQEVFCGKLPSVRRARWHARIAAALERIAGPDLDAWAAEIAHHLAEAADPPSLARLVPMTLRAADYAIANLAPDQAVALLERALQAKARTRRAPIDVETADLFYRRARALDDMARTGRAAESLTKAFDLYSALGRVDRMVDVALTPVQQVIHLGPSVTWSYADSGLASLRQRALAAAPQDSIQQARLLAQQSAPAEIEKALAIARRERDQTLEMTALWHLSHAHLCAGQTELARSEEDGARSIAARLGDRWGARFLLYWRCRSSTLVGDLAALKDSVREMLADAEREHSRLSLAAAHQAGAIAAHLVGDWEGCREHARECLRLQPAQGETHSHAVALATLALTECETGHLDAAEEHVRMLGAVVGNPTAPFPFYLAKMAWITGDTRRIDAAAEALGEVPQADVPFEWATMSRNFALALIAVLRGDRGEAARYLDYYRHWKGLHIPWNASGMASDILLALLLETLGRHEQARIAFEEALGFCRRSGYLPELARACRDYGEALARQDAEGAPVDAARGLKVLEEGLATARSLGMTPTVERIQTALGRLRGSARAPRERGRPAQRVEGEVPSTLSPREIEILSLVARGFTNAEIGKRLFISQHTVARHIQNVLQKTGMANRTEATAFAFRNGLLEQ